MKRGRRLSFDGANWRTASDDRWEEYHLYVPHYGEPLVGDRVLRGVKHLVFLARDGSFLAQPEAACLLPVPADPLEEVPMGYEPILDEKKDGWRSSGSGNKAHLKPMSAKPMLVFSGKNWRLSGDRKWTETVGFVPTGDPAGTKVIGGHEFNVYANGAGFVAVRS
jgi:hypothetical protein